MDWDQKNNPDQLIKQLADITPRYTILVASLCISQRKDVLLHHS